MKYEIMLSILFELLSKKLVTAKYLAEKYEVNVRSIHRYISSLELAGVPVYTIRGNGGGFAIVDTYKLSSTFLTPNELEQTVNALNAIVQGVPNKTLGNVITKLKANAKNEFGRLNLKSGNLIIDAGPWGDAIGYKSKLSVIQQAIENFTLLNITYHDRNGSVTQRNIEPHIIVFKQGLWYVYAYCHLRKQFRFFKIGRIEKAKVLTETFMRREIEGDELPLDFWNNANIDTVDIIMEINDRYLSDVEEWLGVENVKKINDKFIAEAKLPFDDGLVSKIMSYGDGIKVISPTALKNKIKDNAVQLLSLY